MPMDALTWARQVLEYDRKLRHLPVLKDDAEEQRPEPPTAACANPSCNQKAFLDGPPRPSRMHGSITCSGCSGVRYCSYQCQVSSWASQHETVCTAPPSVALDGIHLCVKQDEEDEDAHVRRPRFLYRDETAEARKTVNIDIVYTHPGTTTTVKVGHMIVEVIELATVRRLGFFECLDEYSRDLMKLAGEFDSRGRILRNNGCWGPKDLRGESYLVYLEEVIVDVPWRGKGIGGSLFPMLFQLRELNGAGFIFVWPNVLNDLEPRTPANGRSGGLTLAEEEGAWVAKRDRIVKFYRMAGFRRLANSSFFCLAKDTSHASHSVSMVEDAPYKERPEPTDDEMRRIISSALSGYAA